MGAFNLPNIGFKALRQHHVTGNILRKLQAQNSSKSFVLQTNNVNFRKFSSTSITNSKILITGSLGQLGAAMAVDLRKKHGANNVIMSDVVKAPAHMKESGPFVYADILDYKNLQSLVVNYDIDTIVHFSALLSASGEHNVSEALKINVYGFHNVIELCRRYGLKLFCPSTIGAFGADSPRNPTPDVTIQRPRTIYGVSKVHMELMGEYYHHRYGLDFRSARYPGVVSALIVGGGTTDYAVDIFHHAIQYGKYCVYLTKDTRLPMIYIDDLVKGTSDFIDVPSEKLKIRTYNVAAVSFTPEEIAAEIRKFIPEFQLTYDIDPVKQKIADGWPQVLEDKNARNDWGWNHKYDLPTLCHEMFRLLGPRYGKSYV